METLPEEQVFAFTAKNKYEVISKWVRAIVRLPFVSEIVISTPAEILVELGTIYNVELDDGGDLSFQLEGRSVDTGWLETPDPTLNKFEYCFYIAIDPPYIDHSFFVGFYRNNRAELVGPDKILASLGIAQGDMTWQQAYDVLCKLAVYEQSGVPEFKE